MSEQIVANISATFENQTLNVDTSVTSTQNIDANLGEVYNIDGCKVLYNTTEYWNSHHTMIAKRGYIYVYSDYKQDGDKTIAGMKVGDGLAYLIDMPFIDEIYAEHVVDVVRHITSEERAFWNNKVRCYINTEINEENLIFTTQ